MCVLKKYPRSILGVLVNGFRLCRLSFSEIWYWMFLSCISIFLLSASTDLVGLFVDSSKLKFLIRISLVYVIGVPLSIFFNCLICLRMHAVILRNEQRVKDSIEISFKRMWRLLAYYPIFFVVFLCVCCGLYFSLWPLGIGIVNKMFILIFFVIFIFMLIFQFMTRFLILFENGRLLRSVKTSFAFVKNDFFRVFPVLFFFVIVNSIVIMCFIRSTNFYLTESNFSNFLNISMVVSFVYFFQLVFIKFYALIFNAICMSVFYNLKAKEGLVYDQAT